MQEEAAESVTNGATVFMRITPNVLGEFLHRLEYEPDIFVMDRRYDAFREIELWTLRSDRFPADWEGREVDCMVSVGLPGILEFRVYAAV